MALPASEFMTTTANFLDGYRIVRTFGVVRGITVRSRSVFGTLARLCSSCAAARSPFSLSSASEHVTMRSRWQ